MFTSRDASEKGSEEKEEMLVVGIAQSRSDTHQRKQAQVYHRGMAPASRKAYGERLVLGWPTETEGPQEQLDVCSRTAHGERSLLTGYWWNSETPACSHPSASRIGEAAATEIRIYDPGEDLGFLPFWVMLRGSATDLAPALISSGNQEVQAVAGRAFQTFFCRGFNLASCRPVAKAFERLCTSPKPRRSRCLHSEHLNGAFESPDQRMILRRSRGRWRRNCGTYARIVCSRGRFSCLDGIGSGGSADVK